MKKYISLVIATLLLIHCKNKTETNKMETNKIVISCLFCKGCVQSNLKYIKEKRIDLKTEIILDSTCIGFKEFKPILRDLKFKHLPSVEIEERYGVIGNFILIDSIGRRVDFKTDMHLEDYIK